MTSHLIYTTALAALVLLRAGALASAPPSESVWTSVVLSESVSVSSASSASGLESAPNSASAEDIAVLAPLLLLQTGVLRLQGRSEEAVHSAVQSSLKFEETQSPDISQQLSQINRTMASVDFMVGLANNTATETLEGAMGLAKIFADSIGQMAETAQSMEALLGEDAVTAVISFVQELGDLLSPMAEELHSYAEDLHSGLRNSVAEYERGKSNILEKFAIATEKVAALRPAADAKASVQEGELDRWPLWLRHLFGGVGVTPCKQVVATIQEANETVTEMHDILGSMSLTMCQDILHASMVATTNALAQANASFVSTIANAGGSLPEVILGSVSKAGGRLFSLSDGHLQADLEATKTQMAEVIHTAQMEVRTFHDTAQKLSDEAREICQSSSI